MTPKTVTYQAALSMAFSRQEYWSGLSFLLQGNLPDPGVEPTSPASPESQADSLLSELQGKQDEMYFWYRYCQGCWHDTKGFNINLVDEAGLKGLTPLLTVRKMLWNSVACCREIILERKTLFMWHTSLSSYLKKLQSHPSIHQPPLISQQLSTPWQDLHQQ